MKILLIAYYYPPLNSGGTERPLKMAHYLPRFGHPVTVLTHSYQRPPSETPSMIRFYDLSHNNHRTGLYNMLWLMIRGGTEIWNMCGRYASIFSYWRHAVIRNSPQIIRQACPDLILATYPPVENLEIGIFLSTQYRIPLVADFRDGLLFEPIERTRIQRHPCIQQRYEQIEEQTARQASLILTVSPPITEYFMTKYHCQHVVTLPNGFDQEEIDHAGDEIEFVPQQFHIVHTGQFGASDIGCDIRPFVNAFQKFMQAHPNARETVRLHLIGQLTPKEHNLLHDLVNDGIIVLYGHVTRSRALAFQSRADLLLVITGIDRKSALTSKLPDYLGANRPVLALTSQTYAETVVRSTGVGWVVHPHDEQAIYQELLRIITDRTYYESLQPSAEAIAKFSRKQQMKELSELLNNSKNVGISKNFLTFI